jgi:hypothetical protein
MKKLFISLFAAVLIIVFSVTVTGQSQKSVVNKYMKELPHGRPDFNDGPQKYRMTAVYTNRDLYGNFTGKTKVTGDYTCGLENGMASWNNVSIANSGSFSESFPEGVKQEYMEYFKYVPSSEMLNAEAFKTFPANPQNVFARNLIWDMYSIEIFAWNYLDSLKLNHPYILPDISGQFDMAEIGKYNHNKILVDWKGITEANGKLCAIIDFTADDNLLEIEMPMIKTKGTEQYWGTVLVSLTSRDIEYAVMYGGTIQEIEVSGMNNKFLVKTIRELEVNRIK